MSDRCHSTLAFPVVIFQRNSLFDNTCPLFYCLKQQRIALENMKCASGLCRLFRDQIKIEAHNRHNRQGNVRIFSCSPQFRLVWSINLFITFFASWRRKVLERLVISYQKLQRAASNCPGDNKESFIWTLFLNSQTNCVIEVGVNDGRAISNDEELHNSDFSAEWRCRRK